MEKYLKNVLKNYIICFIQDLQSYYANHNFIKYTNLILVGVPTEYSNFY